jgi:lantibiotic modifying enzyme
MRNWGPTRIVTLLLLQLLICTTACADEADEADNLLLLTEDVGRWIAGTAVETKSGVVWPDNALAAEEVGYDLASGVSGKVVYFVALYRATGKNEYLDYAKQGADYLISVLREPAQFDGDQRRASLYSGIAGIGVALLHVRSEASEPRYDAALQTVLALLDKWSKTGDEGAHWSEQFNDLIYGDAGTVLFLGHVARLDGNSRALEMARQGAQFLLSQGLEGAAGRYWLFRRDKEFNLPNFSHGTAGIAYVLATVGELTGEETLLDGAKTGFDYIRSIAEFEEGRLQIPYGWGSGNWDGLYEFGWAHGLTGAASMFMRMQQVNIDARHAQEMLALTISTLADIGLPGTPVEPFAEPSTALDLRFGRAGVLSLVSYWAARHPEDGRVTALRDALRQHIESAAIRDADTAHWQVDAPAFMGGGRAAYTGLFHGAAGIGLALLKAHASMVQKTPYADLPDDPF